MPSDVHRSHRAGYVYCHWKVIIVMLIILGQDSVSGDSKRTIDEALQVIVQRSMPFKRLIQILTASLPYIFSYISHTYRAPLLESSESVGGQSMSFALFAVLNDVSLFRISSEAIRLSGRSQCTVSNGKQAKKKNEEKINCNVNCFLNCVHHP